jgi:glycosyltransferase involved in cell wall biosynthesis
MGGIERALSVLANKWVKLGFEVRYVSCLKSDPFYELDSKIKVIEPNFRRSGGLVNKIIFYPKLIFYIRSQIKNEDPDRVLSFGDFFNPIVLLAASGLKNPVYISDRTSFDFKFPKYIKVLKNNLYPKSAGFIAQTSRAFEAKKKQFGAQFNQVVIPNAIREIKKTNEPKENIILYVGRFSWEKNPIALLQAFSSLENKSNWKLVMAGDGPQWEEMKRLASDLGIREHVTFLGTVSDVDTLLNKASIFVLPSVLEGFPNALCEAMGAGLPVICFDSIPYESIITPDIDGIVIPYNDTEALASALNNLMEDQPRQFTMGERAYSKSRNWEVEKIVTKYSEFLKLNNDI